MGREKLGSWWAAGSAVCLLILAGASAQSAAPTGAAAAAESPAPVAAPGVATESARAGPRVSLRRARRRRSDGLDDAAPPEPAGDRRCAARRGAGDDHRGPRLRRDHRQQSRDVRRQDDELREHAGDEPRLDPPRRRRDAERRADEGRSGERGTGAIRPRLRGEDGQRSPGGDRSDAEGPGAGAGSRMAAMLQSIVPPLMQQQADAMALVAALPVPQSPILPMPGQPAGVSRTNTGIDTRPGVAP